MPNFSSSFEKEVHQLKTTISRSPPQREPCRLARVPSFVRIQKPPMKKRMTRNYGLKPTFAQKTVKYLPGAVKDMRVKPLRINETIADDFQAAGMAPMHTTKQS